VTKSLCITPWFHQESITHQQLSLSTDFNYTADGSVMSKIIDLKTCTPEIANAPPFTLSEDILNPVPNTHLYTEYVDQTQDLIITVNVLSHSYGLKHQINFRTISTGKEHPLAHGSCIVTCAYPDTATADCTGTKSARVSVLGDRLAFYGVATIGDAQHWSLQVWNWHQESRADVRVLFCLSFGGLI
jgi:hypothetical protein